MGDYMKVQVINGPNLNLLGTREPEIYGYDTLADITARCQKLGDETGMEVSFLQSNYEGQIVTWIQEAIHKIDAIIINAGAYTHTSIAIHDALRAYTGFTVELHISNPHLREPFRHISYVSSAADAIVAGLGVQGYEHTITMLAKLRNCSTKLPSSAA
ncbi:MAG: 3-dehydroquinate dehydratase-2 [Candidatus Azotimanducaceae bacterium]|jgi:3-dehydroquinate dehydratase-2